jgi:PTH1 family peptidyl-tRNA hydrolase
MKLIVGLGNYPKKYEKTRHNAGFIAVDAYCKTHEINLNETKFNGVFAKFKNDFIIAKPLTLMNLSGIFIEQIIKFYQIAIEDILILCDDIYTPVGQIVLKEDSSSGGHNGLNNIFDLLHTQKIKRIKIGVGIYQETTISIIDYVLQNLSANDYTTITQQICPLTTAIIDDFINNVE